MRGWQIDSTRVGPVDDPASGRRRARHAPIFAAVRLRLTLAQRLRAVSRGVR